MWNTWFLQIKRQRTGESPASGLESTMYCAACKHYSTVEGWYRHTGIVAPDGTLNCPTCPGCPACQKRQATPGPGRDAARRDGAVPSS
ncbi:hypothetical protein GCM10010505_70070 [Kitasatospora aburaviensis]